MICKENNGKECDLCPMIISKSKLIRIKGGNFDLLVCLSCKEKVITKTYGELKEDN